MEGSLEIVRLHRQRREENCANRCMAGTESSPLGYRPATHRVNLAGYPLGYFCEPCVKEMRKVWADVDTPYQEWLAARERQGAELPVAA